MIKVWFLDVDTDLWKLKVDLKILRQRGRKWVWSLWSQDL